MIRIVVSHSIREGSMTTEKKDLVHLAKPLAESAVAPGECGSVPDGWKLVPIEPTEAMLVAMDDAFTWQLAEDGTTPAYYGPKEDRFADHKDAYRAMLAAAPSGMQPPNNQPSLICKSCGVDRSKEDCKGDRLRCGLASIAQSGISSLDRRPNEKTFADKTGTFADTSNCFIQTEQPSLSDRARFEKWMIEEAKIVIGSSDPYPSGLERDYWNVWQAAISAQRQDSDKAEQAAMYQWIRSNVSEDMQWYLFGHVVNSPEDFDKAIRMAIANGAPK